MQKASARGRPSCTDHSPVACAFLRGSSASHGLWSVQWCWAGAGVRRSFLSGLAQSHGRRCSSPWWQKWDLRRVLGAKCKRWAGTRTSWAQLLALFLMQLK